MDVFKAVQTPERRASVAEVFGQEGGRPARDHAHPAHALRQPTEGIGHAG